MITGRRPQWVPRLLHSRPLILGLLLAALMIALGQGRAPTAGEEPRPPASAALPPELAAVPRDALGFVSVRVADLWRSDLVADARRLAMKAEPKLYQEVETKELERFEKQWGMPWTAIERFTMVMIEPPDELPQEILIAFITTTKPYDRDRLLKTRVPGTKEHTYRDRTYFTTAKDRASAVYLLNDRTYALGNAPGLEKLFDQLARKPAEGPLDEALRSAAQKHLVTAGLNAPPLAPVLGKRLPPQADPFKPLLEVQSATLVADLDKEARVDLRLNFSGATEAEEGEKAVKAAVQMARQFLAQGMKELAKDEEDAPILRAVKQLDATLKAVPVQRGGSSVRVSLQHPVAVDDAEAVVARVRQAAQRITSANNLKNIGLALHDYHDTYLMFPPAAIHSKDGKPLLSWRVAILPYIEQAQLYSEFHLNEPWDSAHNKKLLPRMPKVYAPVVSGKTKDPYATFYQVFNGKGAIFDGKQQLTLTQITNADGTSFTLLAVEAGEAVPWTKPEDIRYDPDKPLPKLGGHLPGKTFIALFADGSVRNIRKTTKEKTVRAMITWAGGETIEKDDD
jgi:hypothetical protein